MDINGILENKKKFIPKSGYNLVGVDLFEIDPKDALFLVDHFDDRAGAEKAKLTSDQQSGLVKYYIYDKNTL